ncbi:MAG: phosphotransacetylase [Candidatus Accumulibacter sp.]|jgi:phosphotransacetylase|nr:phosphotransacetylase [Accumulibacter sp.]
MELKRRCAERARARPRRVVFPDSLDTRVILAARELSAQGYAKPVLLANPFEMRHFCWKKRLGMAGVSVVDPARSTDRPRYAEHLAPRLPKASAEEIDARLSEPLWFAAAMLAGGDADVCIGGNLSSTADVLRAAIRVLGLAEGNKTVSSAFFMLPPEDRGDPERPPLVFADCGVVPQPTPEQLADIAVSAAAGYQRVTGTPPRVAMLSFSSHGSASHPAVDAVRRATELARARDPRLIIDGDLQFDAAIVPQVAAQKTPGSPIAGNANVFVFPSLEAGNIGYKIAQRLGGYEALGPMIQGLARPMHDLSRGCRQEEIVDTTLLAMLLSDEGG